MIFLPASLVASIFGMGFFSTESDPNTGNVSFIMSTQAWIFPVVAVPLTVFIMGLMAFYAKKDAQKVVEQVEAAEKGGSWSGSEISSRMAKSWGRTYL
jgi:hypothetical protein